MTITITLVVRSPSIDLGPLNALIGKSPRRFWRVGEARLTPSGAKLQGVWQDSRWSYLWIVDDNKGIERAFRAIIKMCAPAAAFFAAVVASGGDASFIIRICNRDHCGLQLSVKTLEQIIDLNLELGFETFCIPQSEPDGEQLAYD
jgi:hypothetical protein